MSSQALLIPLRRQTASLARPALAAILLFAMNAGCGAPADGVATDAGGVLIVTQVPAGRSQLHPEPGRRFPAGSRLTAFERSRTDEASQELSADLAAAGNPSLTIDGRRVIFVGREQHEERFSLYSSATDGGDRRLLVGAPYDCAGGAELPDRRVVFAGKVEDAAPPPGLESAWSLFVLTPGSGDGAGIQRITFSGLTELDPYVLGDGRILYSQWLPASDGRPEEGGFALFTVHPDGTGAGPLHGHHQGPDWKLKPRQGAGGDIFFVAGGPAEPGRVAGSLWSAPAATGFELPRHGLSVVSVDPVSDEELLVAALPAGDEAGGLFVMNRDGAIAEQIVAADPEWEVVDAVAVRSRPRPQGQLSMIDPQGDRGLLLAIDARPEGPLGLRAARARLRVAGESRELGEIELAADGSFFAAVPANVPLLLDVLDAEGEVLVETVTPIWVRPKEVRGCVGCHEDPETAPPNRRPQAVLEEPVNLLGQES